MDNALSTLFYVSEAGHLPVQPAGADIAFLGARFHPALEGLRTARLSLQQYFRPYASELQERGFPVGSGFPAPHTQDFVLLLLPKGTEEGLYMLAQGLRALKEDGLLVCAADNKAGGGRLKKLLGHFGLRNIVDISKNKARAACAKKTGCNEEALQGALDKGGLQPVLSGAFVSMPGIFGWDKTDRGSEILAQHITGLKGRGADFGCGYGYLSRAALEAQVSELICIDADFRAVKACQENLSNGHTGTALKFFWEDLSAPSASFQDLDFVVMNPPFHEGRKTDIATGQAFIVTAARALRPGGVLWMVANTHLPYEQVLRENFQNLEAPYEGEGFKVFHGVK